jgi:4-amino-4-deoxy-L-arabinose transferase-like glycosyltransferase
LLPPSRWARWALALLVVFTFVRGGMWAVMQPYFWAPDEDYHFLYVENLTTQGALPDPDKPLYPREYQLVLDAMRYDDYSAAARQDFTGDPKASVAGLEDLSDADREPRFTGRDVNVVHAPVYYTAGAAVNALLGDASPFTRIAAVRWVSAAIGALAVFLAWLLAAQVFRREWLQLTAAGLVALQSMIAFLSGIVTNDIAVTAAYTGALALLLFLLRTAPRTAQGAWVGGAIALGLLVKSTALALLPLAALAYAGQALAWRGQGRAVLRSALLACGMVAALAGWWYARSLVEYGTLTGAATEVVPSGPGEPATLGHIASLASEWTKLTYRTYWWHFYWWEAPRESIFFYVPYLIGGIGTVGLVAMFWRRRRDLLATDPLVRQASLMIAAILILYVPPLATDILRRLNGAGFILVAGRFLLPAYPAVVVLLLIGLRELVPRRFLAWACGGLVALSAAFMWTVWWDTYVHRYYGDVGWGELFRRMSFDRPEFVTPATIWIALIAAVATFTAFAAVVIARALRDRPPAGPDAAPAARTPGHGPVPARS